MDANMGQTDVSVVMAEALIHLERITEHLREKGSNEAANDIAKHTISILDVFNHAISDWGGEKCLMKTSSMGASGSMQHTMVIKNVARIHQHTKGVEDSSWASVAASATPHGNQGQVLGRPDWIGREVPKGPAAATRLRDSRVVWIRPWDPEHRCLSSITDKIVQGPLFSVAYSQPVNAVCVIFQHGSHAKEFLESEARHSSTYGHGLFGPECGAIEGQPYPMTEDIKRMETMNERRRLTFARTRLFASRITEARFKQDIFGMVGEGNVELIWLFNSGNATAVFSATVMARTVRTQFLKLAAHPGPYQDIMVTFSHDPCERPLNRITQMRAPRSSSGPTSIPSASERGFGVLLNDSGELSKRSVSSPHPVLCSNLDGGGWQTVGKRR